MPFRRGIRRPAGGRHVRGFYPLTQFLQLVLGLPPLLAGVAFLPLSVSIFLTIPAMPRPLGWFGPVPCALGLLTSSCR